MKENNTSTEQIEYEYKIRGWAQLFTGSAGLLFCAVMIFLALNSEDSFLGVTMPQAKVNFYYWLSAITTLSLTIAVLYRGKKQQKQDRKIILMAQSMSLPKTIVSNTIINIPYDSIQSLSRFAPGRSSIWIIEIKHEKGKTEISEMGFADSKTFKTLHAQIKERAGL